MNPCVFLLRFEALRVIEPCCCVCLCSLEVAVSEAWNSKSCKCDCEGGESPTESSSIRTGSSMVRGVDCMPGTGASIS